jgi:integrase
MDVAAVERAAAGSVKTRKPRTVPLHEHLIELGFIDYARSRGARPLFFDGEYKPSGDPTDPAPHPSEEVVKAIGRWVRSIGIKDVELRPSHSWRHAFKAMGDRYGISEKMSDAITGHVPANVARGYGTPTLADMAEAMKNFPRYEL